MVITAYKPNGGLEARFIKAGGQVDSVWDFVRTHLGYLPSVKMKGGELEFIQERDPRIIFDRMVAWFVKHGFPVPLSSQEFQAGLSQRFEPRGQAREVLAELVELGGHGLSRREVGAGRYLPASARARATIASRVMPNSA